MRRLAVLLVLTGCASHHAPAAHTGPPATEAPEVLPMVESRVPYQPAPTTTVAPTTTHTHPPEPAVVAAAATPAVRSRGVWAHLTSIRSCESGGNYGAVSSTGKFRGGYQFARSTWDWVARSAGRADLVGVDPASAAPADQDAMAHWLYVNDGPQHWPECRYA